MTNTPPKKRRLLRWLLGVAGAIGAVSALIWWTMVWMPGESYSKPLPNSDEDVESLSDQLKADVMHLSGVIGERNLDRYPQLVLAENWLAQSLAKAGYQVQKQDYRTRDVVVTNLEVEIAGTSRPEEIVIVGAHYDSARGTPGANDNASGVATLLALARSFHGAKLDHTLRFVAFTNEEPPYFHTAKMGSLVYAKRCRQREENIVAAVSLETMGYYSNHPGTQHYPGPLSALYPDQANFIAVIGDVGSRSLVRRVVGAFRRHGRHPSEGTALPAGLPGVGWSDQWSFWQQGYPGVMVTDTAFLRYPYYHHPEDTPDKIDYRRLALVAQGLKGVVRDLTEAAPE